MSISASQLTSLMPSARTNLVAAIVDNWAAAESAGITTALRVAHFITQIAVETGGLRAIEENLRYSASRLVEIWPKRFPTTAAAKPFAYDPSDPDREDVALADKVYGQRLGNQKNGTNDHDGWEYRGSGMLMTTGRDNYAELGFEANPDALRDPRTAFLTAVREWAKRGCNELADRDDVVAVRKAINGGTIGLDEARRYLKMAKQIFADTKSATPAFLEQLQSLLKAKGYRPGMIDGKMGKLTRDAIMAFEADSGLPVTGLPTPAIYETLKQAPAREISEERKSITVGDLVSEPIVQISSNLSKFGKGIIVATGVGTLVDGSGQIGNVVDNVNKLKSLTDAVLSLSPWVFGLAAGAFAIWYANRVIGRYVEAHRKGEII